MFWIKISWLSLGDLKHVVKKINNTDLELETIDVLESDVFLTHPSTTSPDFLLIIITTAARGLCHLNVNIYCCVELVEITVSAGLPKKIIIRFINNENNSNKERLICGKCILDARPCLVSVRYQAVCV